MPFTFFKNLTNHHGKTPPRPHIAQDPPVKVKGKLRKPSIRNSNAPTSPRQPLYVPPTDDFYPPPMRIAAMHHSCEELPPPQSGHVLHGVPLHSSALNHDVPVDAWRAFPPPYRADTLLVRGHPQPRASGASAMPPENPDVSRYYSMSHELEHPQPKPIEPQPPSREWSPIPSVHRESSSQTGRKGSVHGSDDSWGDEGMTTTSLQGRSTPFKQITSSKHSTIGKQPSEHEIRYIEYHAPGTPKLQEPNGLGLIQPQPIRPHDETLTQRTPSPEVIEPSVRERPATWVDQHDDADLDVDADVYHYIVPAGVNVVFQDEAGTEITRVGKVVQTLHNGRPLKSKPIVVRDHLGKELYRDEIPGPKSPATIKGRMKGKSREMLKDEHQPDAKHHPPWAASPPGSHTSSRSTRTIMIDERGNQIPM